MNPAMRSSAATAGPFPEHPAVRAGGSPRARAEPRRLAFPADPRCVAEARHHALEALAELPRVAEIASLLVSELATNALRHTRGGFQLVVDLTPAHVRIEVHDTSPTAPLPRRPDADEGGGRGLLIVGSLADAWGVERWPDGKAVWFELSLPPAGPSLPAT